MKLKPSTTSNIFFAVTLRDLLSSSSSREGSLGFATVTDRSKFGRIFLYVIPLALFFSIFLPSFSPNVRFSYRDVAFYYYPLFQQIQQEWEQGRLPLWNPHENLGQPLAGDPTSSVFYPGKLIFFLSSIKILSFGYCFKVYIWFHILLALVLAYKLARRLNISPSGSIITGIAYTFSGQTLFQYSNVIYLVGAAWAPALFLYSVDFFKAFSHSQRISAVLKLSVVQAITILGGEPQIVYLILFVATIASFFFPIIRPTDILSKANIYKTKIQRIVLAVSFVASVSFITFSLAAIQILPSLEVISRSSRIGQDYPYSLWELTRTIIDSQSNKETLCSEKNYSIGLLCDDFSSNGRSRSIYRFSVGPWRWLEFLFPNVGGRQFPQSSRWFTIFPEEVSVWTPTLYIGILPFLLALSSFRIRRGSQTTSIEIFRFILTWIVLLSLFAALGGFGTVWVFRTIKGLLFSQPIPSTFNDRDPIGGLYWILNILIPKFSEFRYPAKLLTLTTLCLACLAGIGWDRKQTSKRFTKVARITLVLTLLALLTSLIFAPPLLHTIQYADSLFGPFQSELAIQNLYRAFVQPLFIITLTLLTITSRKKKGTLYSHSFFTSLFLISLTCFDLYIANSWTVATSPTKLFSKCSEISRQIENDRIERLVQLQPNYRNTPEKFTGIPPTRYYRFPVWFPYIFQEKSSVRRNEERILWDIETLFPKYSFPSGLASIDARGAVSDLQYNRFLDSILNQVNLNSQLAFLDVDYVIGPKFWTQRILSSCQKNNVPFDCSVQIQKVTSPNGRAQLLEKTGFADIQKHTSYLSNEKQNEKAGVETLSYEPNRIVYLVSSIQESKLILAEQYWPDWSATTLPLSPKEYEDLKLVRFNSKQITKLLNQYLKDDNKSITKEKVKKAFEFLRTVNVSKGLHCVYLEYKPKCLLIGAIISLISWVTLILGVYIHRSPSPPQDDTYLTQNKSSSLGKEATFSSSTPKRIFSKRAKTVKRSPTRLSQEPTFGEKEGSKRNRAQARRSALLQIVRAI